MELLQFLPSLSHIVSHGLDSLGLRFNGVYFKRYQELVRPTLIFFITDLMQLLSNAKLTFSQGGATGLKKVFNWPYWKFCILNSLPVLNRISNHSSNRTVWTLLASDLMAYISNATRNWYVQH